MCPTKRYYCLKQTKQTKALENQNSVSHFMRFLTWFFDMGHDAASKMAEMATAISKQVLKDTEKSKGKQ
jgi:hypothetical protein